MAKVEIKPVDFETVKRIHRSRTRAVSLIKPFLENLKLDYVYFYDYRSFIERDELDSEDLAYFLSDEVLETLQRRAEYLSNRVEIFKKQQKLWNLEYWIRAFRSSQSKILLELVIRFRNHWFYAGYPTDLFPTRKSRIKDLVTKIRSVPEYLLSYVFFISVPIFVANCPTGTQKSIAIAMFAIWTCFVLSLYKSTVFIYKH